jgi:hypothetical protein
MINHEPVSVPKKLITEAQVIFSTEAQKIFYDKFTSQIPSHLPRYIFLQLSELLYTSKIAHITL